MVLYRMIAVTGLGLLLLGATAGQSRANTYYVASGTGGRPGDTIPQAGSDSSPTGSISQPFRTIQHAVEIAKAGDIVIVRNGTYAEYVWMGYDTGTTRHGATGMATAGITYKAENTYGALVRSPHADFACFILRGNPYVANKGPQGQNSRDYETWSQETGPTDYITISGFDIQSTGTWGKGISGNLVHDIKIVNNRVHDCGGAGIGFGACDYITTQGNTVYNNCRNSYFNGSAISYGRPIPYTGAHATVMYHNIIQQNQVYGNYIDYNATDRNGSSFAYRHTDGNGIIVDEAPDNPSILIENNACDRNGGPGILVDGGKNIDIFNNTCFQNNSDKRQDEVYYPSNRGEITLHTVGYDNYDPNHFNVGCSNIRVWDNICCAPNNYYTGGGYTAPGPPPARTLGQYNNLHSFYGISVDKESTSCQINQNWLYKSGVTSGLLYAPNPTTSNSLSGNYGDSAGIQSSNPLFRSTTDFHLQSNSPCIGKSTYTSPRCPVDLDSFPRPYPVGGQYDLGAYEYHP